MVKVGISMEVLITNKWRKDFAQMKVIKTQKIKQMISAIIRFVMYVKKSKKMISNNVGK